MNRIIFILLLLFLFFGCSTTEQLAMKSLYSVTNDTREDIRGTLDVNRLLIYKKIGMSSNDVVTLDKFTQNGIVLYTLTVQYLGPDWRFMDQIMIKIDDSLLTLKDETPSRTVNKTSNVTVTEVIYSILDTTIINAIKESNSLSLQYYNDPITIPQEGLDAIKAFIND